jgi:hypothetical protein
MYEHYVPLRGWKEANEAEDTFDYLDNVDRPTFNPLRTAEGRTTEAEDPIATIQSMAHTAVAAGNKNEFKQHIARMILANPTMDDLFFMKKVYVVSTGVIDPTTGIETTVHTTEKPAQDLWDQGMVRYSYKRTEHTALSTAAMSKQKESDVFINGDRYTMVFNDPAIANAINKKNTFLPDGTAFVQEWIAPFSRLIASLQTVLSPAFIAVNQVRDMEYAYSRLIIQGELSGSEAMGYVLDGTAFGAIKRHLHGKGFDPKGNETDRLYEEFLQNGGETGLIRLQTVEKLQKQLEQEVKRTSRFGRTGVITGKALNRVTTAGFSVLHTMSTLSENSTRFAVYMTARKAGKSINQAVDAAKNASVNFNRKGTAAGFFGSLYNFTNAAMQGADNFMMLAAKHPAKFSAGAAMFMGLGYLASSLAWEWGGDDEHGVPYYALQSDYSKCSTLMIPTGKGRFVTLPLLHGFRSFYSLGVMAHQLQKGQKTFGEAALKASTNFIENLAPINVTSVVNKDGELTWRPLVPSIGVPIYDIEANEDFMGNEVYNEPFMKTWNGLVADSKMGKNYANEGIAAMTEYMRKAGSNDSPIIAKGFIEDGEIRHIPGFLDINPSKLEHLLKGYFGGLGKFGEEVVKTGAGFIEAGHEVFGKDAGVKDALMESVKLQTTPIINKFYRGTGTDSGMKKFYQIRDMVEEYDFMKSQANKDMETEYLTSLYSLKDYEVMSQIYKVFKTQIDNLMDNVQRSKDDELIENGLLERKKLIGSAVKAIEEATKIKIKI